MGKSENSNLRQKAEELLEKKKLNSGPLLSEVDALKLLHELQVHQTELELQNDELVLAKEKASEAANEYTELYDFAPSAYFALTKEGKIQKLNFSGANMLGKDRSQIKNSIFSIFVSKESKPVFNKFLENMFTSKVKESCDLSLKTGDTTSKYVHLSGIANGNTKLCFISIIDITERKLAEEKLKALEQQNRAWLENSPACTKIVDLDFNLQFMSKAGIEDLKIDDIAPYYGKPYPFHFYPESFKNKMTGNMKKAIETGEVITQEAPVVDINSNEIWFHSTIVPVKNDSGQIEYLIIVSLDTTERKQAEEKLKKLEKKIDEN